MSQEGEVIGVNSIYSGNICFLLLKVPERAMMQIFISTSQYPAVPGELTWFTCHQVASRGKVVFKYAVACLHVKSPGPLLSLPTYSLPRSCIGHSERHNTVFNDKHASFPVITMTNDTGGSINTSRHRSHLG